MAPEIMPMYSPLDLKSATVLITGGSSGIGQGLAAEFLQAGSTVIITGRRESALKDAQHKHPKLLTCVNDASKAEDREELSRWVVKAPPSGQCPCQQCRSPAQRAIVKGAGGLVNQAERDCYQHRSSSAPDAAADPSFPAAKGSSIHQH